jgi:hypothetical protein
MDSRLTVLILLILIAAVLIAAGMQISNFTCCGAAIF